VKCYTGDNYRRQGGYVVVVVRLFVCLLATLRKNFRKNLHEIFTERWQWANEQMIKFGGDPDPYRDTSKTCLGGGMHCPSSSRLLSATLNIFK